MTNSTKGARLTRRTVVSTALAGTAVGSTGCIGGFNLSRSLYDWNMDVSSSKWVDWLLFLALLILPVYSIAMFVDLIVLNSVEFWTGKNPVRASTKDLGNGRTVVSKLEDDPNVVRHEIYQDGQLKQVFFIEKGDDGQVRVLDKNGGPILVGKQKNGDMAVEDDAGRVSARLTAAQLKEAAQAVRAGGSPAEQVAQQLTTSGQAPMVRGGWAHVRRRVEAS